MKNNKCKMFLSLFSVILFSIVLFGSSVVSSFAFFGGDNSIILSKSKDEVVSEEADALITSFEIQEKLIGDWNEQKVNFDSDTKYVASTGRYYSFTYNNQTINFIETKNNVFDMYYSFFHVYCGTKGSWSNLSNDNSIIISKIVESKFNLKIGDTLSLDNGMPFKIVGICDGMPNSSKNLSGNLFADVFDMFAFVLEGNILSQESGYFQRIESRMANKQFSLRLRKWYSLKGDYNFKFNMSCASLKNKLSFCDNYFMNTNRYLYGILCIVFSVIVIIFFIFLKKKKIILDYYSFGKSISFLHPIFYLVIWFLLAFVTSRMFLPLDGVSLSLGNLNTYSLNSLVMLIGLLSVVYFSRKKNKNCIAHNKDSDDCLYEVSI